MTVRPLDASRHVQVLAELGLEPSLKGTEIGISVDGDVATLFGCVETHEQKIAAERAVLRVHGIHALAVELVEKGRWPHPPTDTSLAHAVAECLRRESASPETVYAQVEHASVTLKGEVDLFHQRDAIEHAIHDLCGVKVVVNLISVRPPESQADIHSKVRSAVIREMTSLDPEHRKARRAGDKEPMMVQIKKVLVIDDDDDFRASVRPVLESAGYAVFEGREMREGLAQLVAQDPDVIVLDIMMESIEEGYGVNQAIKFQDEYKKYHSTPIVMVSSIQETPDDRFPRAPELAMIEPDAYLTKPLDMERFLEVVERLATRKEPR
jgi:CheY-like chemotaxis protein/osmotically-inducible protein OsmY